jgi:hypothetical protein
MFDSSLGLTLTNARYAALAEVESHTATRDLKMLVDAGWLSSSGEKKGRVYTATDTLRSVRKATRVARPVLDPYDLVKPEADPRLSDL